MSDRLSDFGYNFQIKFIASLFSDRTFLQQIIDILDPSYFEAEANKFIVKTIKNYFLKYKQAPTMEVMKVKIQEIENEVLAKTVVENLKDSFRFLEASDLDFVKEESLKFCKNQKLKRAILESVDMLKAGEFDSIKTKIDEAMKAGSDRSVGHEYNDSIDARYEKSVRDVVPTNWEVINDLADGGLGKGELGVFVAPAGIGKSWALINVGAEAIRKGLKVIHYTLELNESYVGLRYDSVFSGIGAQNLKYHLEDVKKVVSKYKHNSIIDAITLKIKRGMRLDEDILK